jgi:protein subunit release factor A
MSETDNMFNYVSNVGLENVDGTIQIDVYRNPSAINSNPVAVRVVHLATGIINSCESEKGVFRNTQKAVSQHPKSSRKAKR